MQATKLQPLKNIKRPIEAVTLALLLFQPACQSESKEPFNQQTNKNDNFSITTTTPYSDPQSSREIVDILEKMTEAIFNHDLKTLGLYIHENCTAVNARTGKEITGKKAVLLHLASRYQRYSGTGNRPLIGYEIDHPYVLLKENQAVATYVANAKIGGDKPHTLSSKITEIFTRENGHWKSIHYRCNWQDRPGGIKEDKSSFDKRFDLNRARHLIDAKPTIELMLAINESIQNELQRKKLEIKTLGSKAEIVESNDFMEPRSAILAVHLAELQNLFALSKQDLKALVPSSAISQNPPCLIVLSIGKTLEKLIEINTDNAPSREALEKSAKLLSTQLKQLEQARTEGLESA
ncbi:MAG: nuclear transport factor 2 family protein, partial [Candidatus Obscuribacterales bacterium]|nr:nuclear transport factor 2 family protein [Candidatus Obscuribacterales bacterium]